MSLKTWASGEVPQASKICPMGKMEFKYFLSPEGPFKIEKNGVFLFEISFSF